MDARTVTVVSPQVSRRRGHKSNLAVGVGVLEPWASTMSRPQQLRSRPRFDRSHWPQLWTEEWRYQVADYFCGRGGVGSALSKWLPHHMYFGVDIEPFGEEYPGQFIQADLIPQTDAEGEYDFEGTLPFTGTIADIAWVSWPCTAYSSLSATYYGSAEEALTQNERIPDEFREWLLQHHAHYVIENVPGATRVGDLDANCRVNGLAFGEPFGMTRHFETTFDVPDAYVKGRPELAIDTRGDQSVKELAESKGIPDSWSGKKQAVRSAIPWQYVWYILGHCPAIEIPVPKTKNRPITEWGEGVGHYLRYPEDRIGETDYNKRDRLDSGPRGTTVD